MTHVHDTLKDTVHHDVFKHDILTNVVSGSQNDEQKTETKIPETSCSSQHSRRAGEGGGGGGGGGGRREGEKVGVKEHVGDMCTQTRHLTRIILHQKLVE